MKAALTTLSIIHLVVGAWLTIGFLVLIAENDSDGYTAFMWLWAMSVVASSILTLINIRKK